MNLATLRRLVSLALIGAGGGLIATLWISAALAAPTAPPDGDLEQSRSLAPDGVAPAQPRR